MVSRSRLALLAIVLLVAAPVAASLLASSGSRGGGCGCGGAPGPVLVAFAEPPEELQLPPATLVAWTRFDGLSLGVAEQAISRIGSVVEKTDEYVKGLVVVDNFAPVYGGYVRSEVYIVAYRDGLVAAYTPAYTPEGFIRLVYVKSLNGNMPLVEPVVYTVLRLFAEKAGVTLGSVSYGTTQYRDAKTLYILWSDVRGVSCCRSDTMQGSFTIPDETRVVAASAFLVARKTYYDNLHLRLDGRAVYRVDYKTFTQGYACVDVTERLTPGRHTVSVYVDWPSTNIRVVMGLVVFAG